MKYKNFTIGTHCLGNNPEPVQGYENMYPSAMQRKFGNVGNIGKFVTFLMMYYERSTDLTWECVELMTVVYIS